MNYLTLLAVLPGLALLILVYKQDKIEKEPKKLIIKLLIWGAVSIIPAVILETLGTYVLTGLYEESSNPYMIIDNFIVVGISEEFCKRFVLKKVTWNHSAFNYTFDGIVYSVCASLGFAILENILYVAEGGIATALLRAVTAIPAHVIFGIFMGLYYGQAKLHAVSGNNSKKRRYLRLSLWIPVLLHGFYDYAATVEEWWSGLIFVLFVVVLDIIAFKKIKKASKADTAI